MRRLFPLLVLVAVVVGGCQVGVPPDPNDPAKVPGILKAEVLQRNLKGAADALNERKAQGEINDERYRELMTQFANELLDDVPIGKIPPDQAWQYAEVYLTAQRWKDAEEILRSAVKAAKNEDRRVNDTLRLARAIANQGRIDESVTTARKVLDAAPRESAPILPAVLYEIVPPLMSARGIAGKEPEVAKLLEEAIEKHMTTIVDHTLEPGKAFLASKPFHVRRAWDRIVELYANAGRADEARSAARRGSEMLRTMGQS